MGRVVDLERAKVEHLARELLPELRERGALARRIDHLEDVDRWRRAARRASRLLGWRVRTGVGAEFVWASSEDWPVPPGALDQAAERVMDAIRWAGAASRKKTPPPPE